MPLPVKYAAFLRGINVGGHAIIKMENLREIFTSFGLKNVSTYIQSGNVIFLSPKKDQNALKQTIETGLKKQLGYEVKIFVRSLEQIEEIIKENPFNEIELNKNLVLYSGLLYEEPSADAKKLLTSFNNDIETFIIKNSSVYCLVRKDTGKPNFSPNWLEKKLKMPITTRNWNTIKKMYSLMAEGD